MNNREMHDGNSNFVWHVLIINWIWLLLLSLCVCVPFLKRESGSLHLFFLLEALDLNYLLLHFLDSSCCLQL